MEDVIKTEEKETKAKKAWRKVKEVAKKYAPIVFGGLLVIGGNAVLGYMEQKKGYAKGFKDGHWDGVLDGCGLKNTDLNIGGIHSSFYGTDDISGTMEEDPDFKYSLDKHDLKPEDVLVAKKIYSFVTKDDVK